MTPPSWAFWLTMVYLAYTVGCVSIICQKLFESFLFTLCLLPLHTLRWERFPVASNDGEDSTSGTAKLTCCDSSEQLILLFLFSSFDSALIAAQYIVSKNFQD